MRRLVLSILLLAAPQAHSQTLRDARTALQKGNYAEAEETYVDLAKIPQNAVPAAIGLSKALEAQGKYDEALAAVEIKAPSAELLARKADLLFFRGRWDDAKKTADAALKISPDNFSARWTLARILRDSGDWPAADKEFGWFIRHANDNDVTDPDDLLILGFASLERARYHHLADQYETVLEDVFDESVAKDKLFWQGHYEAGRLFAEKHNKEAAPKRFNEALKINPRPADVFALRAEMAYSTLDLKDAISLADQALAINPNHPGALRVKAAVHLFGGENDKALAVLDVARKINPRDETTLALYASVLHAQKRMKEFAAVLNEVESFNPKAWRFNYELGSHLDSRKLFLDSGKYFERSIEMEPKMPEGYEGLGMLQMRMGDEAGARKSLTEAIDADPFNVRVSNTIKVLDHLKRYETIRTKNYIVRFDPKNDAVLARFVVHYLENLHQELAKKFDFEPKEPYLIEIFNKHEMFSGRVTALPDLHTIGACTGRMFAMVSTHDKQGVIKERFNWNRVLRHEVVHLFNLDQTKFQIPHWFTEGLAVTLEGKTTPPRWNYILAEKLNDNDLLNLDNILLGFVRPKSPDQWQQAYLQSELYVQYLIKTHGEPAVGKLLAAFAEGHDTDAALPKAIGVTKADFEKGYRAFIEKRVKDLKLPAHATPKSYKDLKEEFKRNPDDPDVIAQLAEAEFKQGNGKKALELADEALRKKLNHPLAAYVKASVLFGDKKSELANAVLATAVEENPDEPKSLKLLARIQFETKNFPDAAKTLERGRALEPFEPYWLGQLAKVYLQTKNEEKLMDVLKSVAEHDPDDTLSRTKLADWCDKQKMWPEAERYARQLLEIDVKSAIAADILLRALEEQGKADEKALYQKLLTGE